MKNGIELNTGVRETYSKDFMKETFVTKLLAWINLISKLSLW